MSVGTLAATSLVAVLSSDDIAGALGISPNLVVIASAMGLATAGLIAVPVAIVRDVRNTRWSSAAALAVLGPLGAGYAHSLVMLLLAMAGWGGSLAGWCAHLARPVVIGERILRAGGAVIGALAGCAALVVEQHAALNWRATLITVAGVALMAAAAIALSGQDQPPAAERAAAALSGRERTRRARRSPTIRRLLGVRALQGAWSVPLAVWTAAWLEDRWTLDLPSRAAAIGLVIVAAVAFV